MAMQLGVGGWGRFNGFFNTRLSLTSTNARSTSLLQPWRTINRSRANLFSNLSRITWPTRRDIQIAIILGLAPLFLLTFWHLDGCCL